MDILGYLPRSLDCHAQDVDEDDDESTSEAPDAGTTSDLEELDSSLSSTAPASSVSGATGSTESSASRAKMDRLIRQLKNLKMEIPMKSGCKGGCKGNTLEHESPDVSNKKDVGHTPSSSDSSLSPKQRLALYFQRKRAEKAAQGLGVTENPKVEVDKDATSSLNDPAAPEPHQNRYVLPDHATCFTKLHIFICRYIYVCTDIYVHTYIHTYTYYILYTYISLSLFSVRVQVNFANGNTIHMFLSQPTFLVSSSQGFEHHEEDVG